MMSSRGKFRMSAMSYVSVFALAMAAASPAYAQASVGSPNPPTDVATTNSDPGALTDIIVTAQRRGEKLQDTPITVSAITSELARAKGVTSTSDLQIVTPGLVFADSGAGPALYLRGVGTQNTAPGDEGSVSTYIDGVYYAALPNAFSSLANVQRVEVLKGPQGTLFGRNATGGLINIITQDPSFKPTYDIRVNAGSYQTFGGDLYASAPLSSTVAANISAYGNDQEKGFGRNLTNGKYVYNGYEYGLRTKLLWQPGADTRFVFSGDYSLSHYANSSGAILPGAVSIDGTPGLKSFYDLFASLQPLQVNKGGGVSLHAQQDLSWARLLSISAYRENYYRSDFDSDRTSSKIVDAFIRFNDKQFSQELQIQSLPTSLIKWIGGVYYLKDRTALTSFDLVGAGLAAAGGEFNGPASQKTRSMAGYAQVTVPLGALTNVTGGVRYTDDRRRLTSATILPAFKLTIPGPPQSSHFNKLTYRASIDHHFSRDIMMFASYNRGFKSGVFNLYAPKDPPARPETLDAFEIGLKSEFFDRRLRVNVSPFLYKYKDIQLVQAFTSTTRLLNAARATSKGVDFDMSAILVPGLTLDAGFEILHARYDRFPSAPATFPKPAVCTPVPTELLGPRTGGNLNCVIDASGNQLIRAPDFSGTLGLSYAWRASFGKLSATANLFHSASFPYEAGGRLRQAPYEVVNAQIGWRSISDRLGARVFVRNLTNKHYFTNLVSSAGDIFAPAAPRTVGIELNVKM